LITVQDELLITKEINAVTIDYVKKIVFRKLLMSFCFELKKNAKRITGLIQSLNFYGIDVKPTELEFELLEELESFIDNLKKEERTALYFWVLNQRYLLYLDEFEYDDDTYSESEYDKKFSRELAYKIYEPKNSNLRNETIQELKSFLYNFASELDLSLIDEYTSNQILEEIDNYCS
tara:strand:- start:257 stop:787 length:531 start_codon:yes stop_codon:yes gene_type:complete